MNKGKSIRNQSEKDVYTPQKHNLNIQFEQVIKTESVSVLESEEGYEPLQLTKPCDYVEMRGYFGPSFLAPSSPWQSFWGYKLQQILEFLKNISAHLFSNFELKILYRHHHSKTRCNAFPIALCNLVCVGVLFWMFLIFKKLLHGFQCHS